MRKTVLSFFWAYLILNLNVFSHDLSIKYASDIRASDKVIMEKVLNEVSAILPMKMKLHLPKDLEIKISQLSNHKTIPDEICSSSLKQSTHFVYGHYDQYKNVLTINTPVMTEFKKGSAHSKRINCQHKSLYNQAIATLIHELTHAYDFNNENVSNSIAFIERAGFKKGLFKIKNKNVQAMRSADTYELVSIRESFAVNMEYFTMDPEFFCRKPSMFNYFKQLFNTDPFPTRTCTVNNTVMVSTPSTGFVPTSLDIKRVYRIDYLLAGAGKGLQSGFGHSMFRIVMCAPERFDTITNKTMAATPFGKKCLEDKLYHLVVSFRANVDDAKLSYLKGITGGYPSMLFILNFGDVLDEYNRDELRDVVSYPLNLTISEREDFIFKVIEAHWNYQGSYKFISNNCAVESFDLLKSAVDKSQYGSKSSLSPHGVLDDLDKMNFLSIENSEKETYPAKTKQIILAFNMAYNFKLKNDKHNKVSVLKFIDESSLEFRKNEFLKFQNLSQSEGDLNSEITLLKQRMITASSFSVMEQQILRSSALKYRKQAAEFLMNSADNKFGEMLKEAGADYFQPFSDLAKTGYGIPFKDEMLTRDDLLERSLNGAESMLKVENALRELMPKEFSTLLKISTNIEVFNAYSLKVRREFRTKLDTYVDLVLKNLLIDDDSKDILKRAASGDRESLKKVRELLGKDLVSEKEIVDVRLRKLIQDLV